MSKQAQGTSVAYYDRIGRVSNHIHDNLDAPLDLDTLADVAAMSRFHWHRVYRAVMGETAAQTVKRLRLARAASELSNSAIRIPEIAKRAGYSSDVAFSRAFSGAYGTSPGNYRKTGTHVALLEAAQAANAGAFPMQVRELPEAHALGAHRTGTYMGIDKAFGELMATLGEAGKLSEMIGAYGVFFDDPDALPDGELRSAAAALFGTPSEPIGTLKPMTIAGGNYAVLSHKGPYSDMRAAYDWLFGIWLPESGHELRDAPILEAYLNDPKTTAPAELLSEILLPIEVA
ncbi:AraC family transcriptional regulator [Planktotalea sp.]|uniref:AraC family transcriptional regulator n=1 Tax=Planktotalea sp. TaxID=2029877 RepID=UPI003D6A5321